MPPAALGPLLREETMYSMVTVSPDTVDDSPLPTEQSPSPEPGIQNPGLSFLTLQLYLPGHLNSALLAPMCSTFPAGYPCVCIACPGHTVNTCPFCILVATSSRKSSLIHQSGLIFPSLCWCLKQHLNAQHFSLMSIMNSLRPDLIII